MRFIASAAAAMLLSSYALAANVVSMQISKRDPQAEILHQNLGLWDLAERATISEDLYNNITGGSYMANVTVGTPGQPISLVIDTGSSDVFVMSATADECTSKSVAATYGPCVGGTYDSSKSSTYKVVQKGLFDISYEDKTGSTGDYIADTFSIAGASVTGLQMGLALKSTVGVGIMGIGYAAGESVTTKNRYPNLIDQLVTQNKINRKIYSLWLDDKETSTGNVLFGGIDTQKFIGTLKALPVQLDKRSNSIRSFIVLLSSLSVTGQDGQTSTLTNSTFSLPVILDSGTTITYVPPDLLAQIITKLGAVDDSRGSGFIFVDCDWRTTHKDVYISWAFGGSGGPVINVPVSEVIRSLRGTYPKSGFKNTCSLGIKSSTSVYLLGDTFLRSAYVVYDLDHNQVALAQTNFEASGSNVQEVDASATGIPLLSGVSSGQTQVPQSYFTTGKASTTVQTSPPTSTSGTTATDSSVTSGTTANTSVGAGGSSPTSAGNGPTGAAGGGSGGGSGGTSGTPGSQTGTPPPKSMAATVPAFQMGSLAVFAISIMFAMTGGAWFLA